MAYSNPYPGSLDDEGGGVGGGSHPLIDAAVLAADPAFTSQFAPAFVADAATYGDGVTNATTHLQGLLNSAAISGGTAFLPAGTYLISTPLSLASHVTLRGVGDESVISSGVDKMNLVESIGTVRPQVIDLKLVGTGTGSQPVNVAGPPTTTDLASSGCGIIFAGVTGGLVQGCTVTECGGTTGTGNFNGVAGIWLTYGCVGCTATLNVVSTCRNGINEDVFFLATNALGNRIINNRIDGCRFGIAVDSGSLSRYCVVADNYVTDCVQSGIDVNRTGYVTITRNQCDNNGAGLTNSGIAVYASVSIPASRIIIRDNMCRSNGTNGIKVSDYVYEMSIVGNQCNSNFRHGIYLNQNTRDALVTNNVCVDNGLAATTTYDGINITTCDRVTVDANRSKDSDVASAVNYQRYGLAIEGTCTEILVGDTNDFSGNNTGPMLFAGTNSRNGARTRERILALAQGIKGENYSRGVIQGVFTPASGDVRGALVGLLAGDLVTNLMVQVAVPGSGLTLSKVGLYDSTGVLLASSADISSSLESGAGLKTLALSTPYRAPADGGYYMALIQVGTTRATIARGISGVSGLTTLDGASGGVGAAINQTGQTDIPAPHSLAATGTAPWFGWN